jgi:hypothetical protein
MGTELGVRGPAVIHASLRRNPALLESSNFPLKPARLVTAKPSRPGPPLAEITARMTTLGLMS